MKRRDAWLDNGRLVAAVLIVVFHFTAGLRPDSTAIAGAWFGTWGFRIPVYIVVAGYFSHHHPLNRRQTIHLFRNILFVYLAAYFLAYLQAGLMHGSWIFDPTRPRYTLWFLLALFWWRLTLPYVVRIRFILPVSIAVAAVIGFFPWIDHTMALSRTFAFWPLFILGWMLRGGRMRLLLDQAWVRVAAWCVIALSLIGGYLLQSQLSMTAFSMAQRYDIDASTLSRWGEAGTRVLILLYGAVGTLALMTVLTRHFVPILTYLGSGSFYIYIVHPLVLQQLRAMDLMPVTESRWGVIAFVLVCVLLALAMGSRAVRWCTRWLIQPRYTWMFVSDEKHPAETESVTEHEREQRRAQQTGQAEPVNERVHPPVTARCSRHAVG